MVKLTWYWERSLNHHSCADRGGAL